MQQQDDLIAKLTEKRAQITDAMDMMASAETFDAENPDWARFKRDAKDLDNQIEALHEAKQQRMATEALRDKLTRTPAAKGEMTHPDVGDQMLRSDSYKTWKRNGSGGRAHLMSLEINRRALVDSQFLPNTATQVVGTPPTAQTPFLNLLRNVQVDALTVPIVSHPDAAPLAGVVTEGAQKPEATITTSEWTVSLQTVAHWVEVTRQALADNSLVRDIVSGSLMRGVMAKAEAEAAAVITGGTYNTVAGGDMLESIRLGLAQVQSQGYSPNGILINPADSASLDIAIWQVAAAFPSQNNTLFGLRVVATPTIAQGSAYVGDFQNGAMWFYRGAAELYVTDSDVGIVATAPVSNFKRNVLTFLAEIMAKAAVIQGEAIAKCTPSGGAITRASAPAPKQEGPARK